MTCSINLVGEMIMNTKNIQQDVSKRKFIHFRVTADEREQLEQRQQQTNLSMSEFCRQMCLYHQIIVIQDMDQVIYELRKIGNNINQLTMLSHQGEIEVIGLDEFIKRMKQIYRLLLDIKKGL